MATWTAIADTTLEPGKPARSIDAIALRDNPIAITEGAAGAPRIQAAGLDTTSAERDWVLARTSGASVGVVGSYALLRTSATENQSAASAGTVFSGSSLRYATSGGTGVSGTPGGSWQLMGYLDSTTTSAPSVRTSVFLRVS